MPLYYGTKPPEEIKPETEPPELDAEALEEIQNESEHLAELIKNEVVEMKHNKQTQRTDGLEIYHLLNNINKAIGRANVTIDRIIENQ